MKTNEIMQKELTDKIEASHKNIGRAITWFIILLVATSLTLIIICCTSCGTAKKAHYGCPNTKYSVGY